MFIVRASARTCVCVNVCVFEHVCVYVCVSILYTQTLCAYLVLPRRSSGKHTYLTANHEVVGSIPV